MHRHDSSYGRRFDALEEFRTVFTDYVVQPEPDPKLGWTGSRFVQTRQLKLWLDRETDEEGNKVKNIERLLEDTFAKHYPSGRRPPDHNEVMRICPLIFCILLEMKHGHLVLHFMKQRVIDAELPYHTTDLEERLKRALPHCSQQDICHLVAEFDLKQWAYCPFVFECVSVPWELERSRVLPIYKRQQINDKGATAAIHQLCIPEDFLGPDMKKRLATSSRVEETIGSCYHLAVKTFQEAETIHHDQIQAKNLFYQELDAYRHLSGQKGMVEFLGAYTCRDSNNRAQYNILLEYGDYDLAEYFFVHPPVLATNVRDFWHNLFSVANALSSLHKFELPRRGQKETYWGWHADIKPDNILSVKGRLKLADPGFAGFAKLVDGQTAPRTSIIGMTSTYGAPECRLDLGPTEKPHAADIWSLGCVFSEAATWLILGPPGLHAYTELREQAIHRFNKKKTLAGPLEASEEDEIGEGDYFHDGNDVLPEIHQWHDYLRTAVRSVDPIATHVLNIVDKYLLQSQPKDRISAKELCEMLSKIERQIPPVLTGPIPRSVIDAMKTIEASLKWQASAPVQATTISIQQRKALKSKGYLDLPLADIGHLSQFVKGRRTSSPIESRSSFASYSPSDSRTLSLKTSPDPFAPYQSTSPTERAPSSYGQSFIPKPKYPPHSSVLRSYIPQNIFDVHFAKKDGEKAILKRFSQSKRKDALLQSKYENRDIVFIADNAGTMVENWSSVIFVLEKLAQTAAWIDEDGMDLAFTNGSFSCKIKDKTLVNDISNAMNRPDVRPRPEYQTDLSHKLGGLLLGWLDKFKQKRSKAEMRKLTLIILTDGIWTGMAKESDVEERIVIYAKNLLEVPGSELLTRPVSIQFVAFGKDSYALSRLRHLDNNLKYNHNIDDIVDTEEWTGDVYKMLLGSFVPNIDWLDEEPAQDNGSATTSDYPFSPTQSHVEYHSRSSSRTERLIRSPSSMDENIPSPRSNQYGQAQREPSNSRTPTSKGFQHRGSDSRRQSSHKDWGGYYRPAT